MDKYQVPEGMDKKTFIDYKFYINAEGDIALDEDPDLGMRLGIKEGDLLRVSRDAKDRLTLQRFGFFADDEQNNLLISLYINVTFM